MRAKWVWITKRPCKKNWTQWPFSSPYRTRPKSCPSNDTCQFSPENITLAKINRQTLKSPTKILYPIYYSRINQNSPYVRQWSFLDLSVMAIDIYYGSTCPERPCLIIFKDSITTISWYETILDCIFVTHSHSQYSICLSSILIHSFDLKKKSENNYCSRVILDDGLTECLLKLNTQQCRFIIHFWIGGGGRGGVWLCHDINPIKPLFFG